MPPIKSVPLDDKKDTKDEKPPRVRATPRPRGQRAGENERIRESLVKLYSLLGAGALTFDPVWGQYVMDMAEDLADSWMEVAESNNRVRDFLVRITEGAGVGTIIASHMFLISPLLARRGIVPAPLAVMALQQSEWVQQNIPAPAVFAYANGADIAQAPSAPEGTPQA